MESGTIQILLWHIRGKYFKHHQTLILVILLGKWLINSGALDSFPWHQSILQGPTYTLMIKRTSQRDFLKNSFILELTLFCYTHILKFMTTVWKTYLCNVNLTKCTLPYKQVLRDFNIWFLWSRRSLSNGEIRCSPAKNGTPAQCIVLRENIVLKWEVTISPVYQYIYADSISYVFKIQDFWQWKYK